MTYDLWPSTSDLLTAFSEEISAIGGKVTDTFNDGRRLYVRSTLPDMREVRPGDKLQAGVAMRAGEREICVHPYVFRLVCRNGAIRAETVQTRIIEREDVQYDDPIVILRQAVRACAEPQAFDLSMREMRSAMNQQADMMLNLLPFMSRLPKDMIARLIETISREVEKEGDRSRYGLMNAVTATARETRDPELRWRLEELGGGIPALLRPIARPSGGRASIKRRVADAIA